MSEQEPQGTAEGEHLGEDPGNTETPPASGQDMVVEGILGAAAGTAIGMLAAGPVGAVIGAVVGAGASAALDIIDTHEHSDTETAVLTKTETPEGIESRSE